jgi:hypothetical protein
LEAFLQNVEEKEHASKRGTVRDLDGAQTEDGRIRK